IPLYLAVLRARARLPLCPYTTLFRSRPGIAPPAVAFCRSVSGQIGRRGEITTSHHAAHPEQLLKLLPATQVTGTQAQQTNPLHRSEEHTSELQSRFDLVCRLLLEKKN